MQFEQLTSSCTRLILPLVTLRNTKQAQASVTSPKTRRRMNVNHFFFYQKATLTCLNGFPIFNVETIKFKHTVYLISKQTSQTV